MNRFLDKLSGLPNGYSFGLYKDRRWGMNIERLAGKRHIKLFAEDLGGSDYVSFNLYHLRSGRSLLKPCEMPESKVIAFVEGVEPLR